jgi:two-component system sensor histidine kinase KdpD
MGSVEDAARLQAMAHAETKRSNLLRCISNDLREPLWTIQNRVVTLLDGATTAPARVQRERLEAVDVEVQRLLRLTNNLIDVGRLETNSVVANVIPTSLGEVVERATTSVETRGRTLDVDVAANMPKIATDPELVQRVLAIVIGNACRFGPLGRPVRVTAGVLEHTVEVLIIDQGPGMTHDRREALLDPTHRLSREQKGIDLGLSVALGFVRLVGGDLRFEDTPSGGLTVVIALPRNDTVR